MEEALLNESKICSFLTFSANLYLSDTSTEYDGQYLLEKGRLTNQIETIVSLLRKGEVSKQSLVLGISEYVEQLGFPTREYCRRFVASGRIYYHS